MAGKTIGELSESVSLDNTNLLAVSSDGNVLKKTTLSTLENSLTVSNFNATSKATIAGLAMPSNNYVNLTLGASGSPYTAPAAGYVTFAVHTTTNPSYFGLLNITANFREGRWTTIGEANIQSTIFVKQGDTFRTDYSNATGLYLYFIYASGSEPNA